MPEPEPDDPRPAVAAGGRTATIVGAVISVLAVAGVVIWALGQDAPSLPTSGGALAAVAGAVALNLVANTLRGERSYVLLRHNGGQPLRADAYGLLAVGTMGNTVLPARGGDALRAILLTPRTRADGRTVIGTVVAERLLDVIVLATLFAIVAYGVLSGIDVPDSAGPTFIGAVALGAVVLAAAAAVILHRRGALGRVIAFLRPMAAAITRLRGRHLAEVLALTILIWVVEIAVWWVVAQALALDVSAIQAAYLLTLASFFVIVPSGPGFAGTLDAGIIFGTRAIGLGGSAALSYLVVLRFVLAVPITLIGLVVLVVRYGGLARLRAVRAT